MTPKIQKQVEIVNGDESVTALHLQLYIWIKCNLDGSTTHLKFDPTGVQTHDLQLITVHFMSL